MLHTVFRWLVCVGNYWSKTDKIFEFLMCILEFVSTLELQGSAVEFCVLFSGSFALASFYPVLYL